MRNLRVLFVVQGDGRGHMTQALAVQRILTDAGHGICAILLGRDPDQPVPEFFATKAAAPIVRYQSFAFFNNRTNTAIDPLASFLGNIRRLPGIASGLLTIRREIARRRPDVVVSFLEPLVGLCYFLFRPSAPLACVANQYLFLHPDYPFPPGRRLERFFIKFYARMTSCRAARRLALSLVPRPDRPGSCAVIPPLLRSEVLSRTASAERSFFLVYLLKAGLRDQIIDWHKRHPEVELHCFTDQPQEADAIAFDDTLTFHRIDEAKFLDLMASCRGMVATAGYQTLCEAVYFGKPILIVPVGNHFEQSCNAHEAELLGVGVAATRFDLDQLLKHNANHRAAAARFRAWTAEAPQRVLRAIESIVRT